jgi:hypothetical protein
MLNFEILTFLFYFLLASAHFEVKPTATNWQFLRNIRHFYFP